MHTFIGKDKNGIPRTYGESEFVDIAETRCKDETEFYIRMRPDSAPMSSWTFERINHQ